eukprot:m51a1_g2098 putative protein phosphatase 2c (1489) ;mRNA; f:1574054-1579245
MAALVNDHALMLEVLEWSNSRLAAAGSQRIAAFPDFQSGPYLCHLIQAITSTPIDGFKERPTTFFDKKANVSLAIGVAEKAANAKIVGLIPSDIATGRENTICELISVLMCLFDPNHPLVSRLSRKTTTVRVQRQDVIQRQTYVRAKTATINAGSRCLPFRKPSVADIFTPATTIAFADPSAQQPPSTSVASTGSPVVITDRLPGVAKTLGQWPPEKRPAGAQSAARTPAAQPHMPSSVQPRYSPRSSPETSPREPVQSASTADEDPRASKGAAARKFWESLQQSTTQPALPMTSPRAPLSARLSGDPPRTRAATVPGTHAVSAATSPRRVQASLSPGAVSPKRIDLEPSARPLAATEAQQPEPEQPRAKTPETASESQVEAPKAKTPEVATEPERHEQPESQEPESARPKTPEQPVAVETQKPPTPRAQAEAEAVAEPVAEAPKEPEPAPTADVAEPAQQKQPDAPAPVVVPALDLPAQQEDAQQRPEIKEPSVAQDAESSEKRKQRHRRGSEPKAAAEDDKERSKKDKDKDKDKSDREERRHKKSSGHRSKDLSPSPAKEESVSPTVPALGVTQPSPRPEEAQAKSEDQPVRPAASPRKVEEGESKPSGVLDPVQVTGHRRRPSREFNKTEIKRHLSPDHLSNADVAREVSLHAVKKPSPEFSPNPGSSEASPAIPGMAIDDDSQQQQALEPSQLSSEAQIPQPVQLDRTPSPAVEQPQPQKEESDPWSSLLQNDTAKVAPEEQAAAHKGEDLWGSMASAGSWGSQQQQQAPQGSNEDEDEGADEEGLQVPEAEPPRRNRIRTELNARALAAYPPELEPDIDCVVDLDISSNVLTQVPPAFTRACSLEILSIACNRIREIPDGSLPRTLRVLRISCNDLTVLPAHILELPQLEELFACACEIKEVEAPRPGHVAPLRRLSLERNKLKTLPEAIGLFGPTLLELVLSENSLQQLPASFAQLECLEELNLSSNCLTKLPEGIARMRNLHKLNFSQNNVAEAPKDWAEDGAFCAMQELQARANYLRSVPRGLFHYCGEMLELLDLSDNELTELPDLTCAVALAALFVGGNKLEEPPQLANVDVLLCLDLSRNKLRRLPDMRDAPQLRMLHLGYNPITDKDDVPPPPQSVNELHMSGLGLRALPDCLSGPLDQVESLALADNELDDIPGMWRCSMALRSADFTRNALKAPPRLCARGADVLLEGNAFSMEGRAPELVAGAESLTTGVRVGWADMLGRRDTMEDAVAVHSNVLGDGRSDLVGLYDGHGGRVVAELFAREYPKQLKSACKRYRSDGGSWQKRAMASAMRRSNKEIKAEALRLEEMQGATALAALFLRAADSDKRTLCVANAGDTRAVLCRGGKSRRISKDHKPLDRTEFARIVEAGGYVTERGQIQGMLSVARAVGDYELRPFVTEEPHFELVELRDRSEDEFVILACDGVWDVMSDECAVRVVRTALAESKGDAFKSAAMLRDWAFLSGSGDNISVVVIVL